MIKNLHTLTSIQRPHAITKNKRQHKHGQSMNAQLNQYVYISLLLYYYMYFMFDSNNLMTYLFWTLTNHINFFRLILNLIEVSV
jgi:hypothetical protein